MRLFFKRLVIVIVMVLLALGWLLTLHAQMPPFPMLSVTPTNLVRHILHAPSPVLPTTNILLTWDRYTNVYFEVVGRTNLSMTNWYHVTNVPVWQTNVTIPVTKPAEFFTIQTISVP